MGEWFGSMREGGVPAAEGGRQLVVEHPRAHLQEEVGVVWRPARLLLLDHALAHDLVDRGLDKSARFRRRTRPLVSRRPRIVCPNGSTNRSTVRSLAQWIWTCSGRCGG